MAMILSALYHDDSSRIFWVKALRKLWWRCPKTKPSSSEFRSNPRGVQSYSKFQLPLVISSRDHQVWKCLTCPKQAYGIPLLPCSLDYLDYTWFHLITLDCFRFRLSDPTLPSYSAVSWRPNPNWNWGHPRDVGSMAPWKPLSAEAWQMGIEHGLHGLQGLQGHCKKSKQFEKSRNFLRNMIQINWKETKSCLGWHQWKQKSCRMLSVIQSGGEWWGVVGVEICRYSWSFWNLNVQWKPHATSCATSGISQHNCFLSCVCPAAPPLHCFQVSWPNHALVHAMQPHNKVPSSPVAQWPSGPVPQWPSGPVQWWPSSVVTVPNNDNFQCVIPPLTCNILQSDGSGMGGPRKPEERWQFWKNVWVKPFGIVEWPQDRVITVYYAIEVQIIYCTHIMAVRVVSCHIISHPVISSHSLNATICKLV